MILWNSLYPFNSVQCPVDAVKRNRNCTVKTPDDTVDYDLETGKNTVLDVDKNLTSDREDIDNALPCFLESVLEERSHIAEDRFHALPSGSCSIEEASPQAGEEITDRLNDVRIDPRADSGEDGLDAVPSINRPGFDTRPHIREEGAHGLNDVGVEPGAHHRPDRFDDL